MNTGADAQLGDEEEEEIQGSAEEVAAAFASGYSGEPEGPNQGDRPRDEHGRFVSPDADPDQDDDEGQGESEDDQPVDKSGDEAPDEVLQADDPGDEAPAASAEESEDEKLARRVRVLEGKLGTIQQHMRDTFTQGAQQAGEGTPTPQQQKTIVERLRAGESFADIEEEFPQWAGGLEYLAQVVQETIPDNTDLVEVINKQQAQIDYLTVETAHRGWLNTVQSPELHTWLATQDPETQALYDSEAPADVISLLNKFESDRKAERERADADASANRQQQHRSEKAQSRLDEAEPPTDGNRPAPRQKVLTAEDAFKAGFEGR